MSQFLHGQALSLNEQRGVLLRKLAPLPTAEIESAGMDGYSPKNWFCVQDRTSGVRFKVYAQRTADFSTPRFEAILSQFFRECRT
jgi:hypothetical protein